MMVWQRRKEELEQGKQLEASLEARLRLLIRTLDATPKPDSRLALADPGATRRRASASNASPSPTVRCETDTERKLQHPHSPRSFRLCCKRGSADLRLSA